MRNEHVVWVVVAKDRQGRPRGFEKTFDERFYLIEAEAKLELIAMDPAMQPYFTVAEARIGYPEPVEPAKPVSLNTKDHIAHMRCTECGHEFDLEPAAVRQNETGGVSRYFGSAYDFCPRCEGAPKEVKP